MPEPGFEVNCAAKVSVACGCHRQHHGNEFGCLFAQMFYLSTIRLLYSFRGIEAMSTSHAISPDPAFPSGEPRSPIRLPELAEGECARVDRVQDRDDLDRLKALGICSGRVIKLVHRGDPMILQVFGTRIGLSARLADHVLVQPCPPSPRCWLRDGPWAGTLTPPAPAP